MANSLDSIYIESEWYPQLVDSLTLLKVNGDSKIKLVAKECLQVMECGVRLFEKGQRAQIVFNAPQKRLLARISEELNLELAQRRFEGRVIGEFEKFGRVGR